MIKVSDAENEPDNKTLLSYGKSDMEDKTQLNFVSKEE